MINKKLLIVLAQQRSGTTVLGESLDAGRSVACLGEVFHDALIEYSHNWFRWKSSTLKARPDLIVPTASNQRILWDEYVSFLGESTTKQILLLDIKYTSWRHLDSTWGGLDHPGLLDIVLADGISVLHLIRSNVFAQACSNSIADFRSVFHLRRDETDVPGHYILDPQKLELQMRASERATQVYRGWFSRHVPYQELFYETLISDDRLSQDAVDKISTLVEVPTDEVYSTPLRKVLPELSRVVENASDIVAHFDRTEFAAMVRSSLGIAGVTVPFFPPPTALFGREIARTSSSKFDHEIASGRTARFPVFTGYNSTHDTWSVSPKFTMKPKSTIAIVGHGLPPKVAESLRLYGFAVGPTDVSNRPSDERAPGIADLLAQRDPLSIRQVVRGLALSATPTSDATEGASTRRPASEVGSGAVHFESTHDELSILDGVPKGDALEGHARLVFDAEVVLLSLATTECCWDTERGRVVQPGPSVDLLMRHPGRFELAKADLDACCSALSEAISILRTHGRQDKRFILMVSPESTEAPPVKRDEVQAKCESKAVLRTVAARLVAQFSDVDYFPFFEFATYSPSPTIWSGDRPRLSDSFARSIAGRLCSTYLDAGRGEPSGPASDDHEPISDAKIDAKNPWCGVDPSGIRLHPDSGSIVTATIEVTRLKDRAFSCLIVPGDIRCRPLELSLVVRKKGQTTVLLESRQPFVVPISTAWTVPLPRVKGPAEITISLQLAPGAPDFTYSAIRLNQPRLVPMQRT